MTETEVGGWLLQQAPVVVVLILAIWGGLKEWWVPGTAYRRVLTQRDEFMRLLMRSTVTAEKATEVMQQQVTTTSQVAIRAAEEALAKVQEEGRLT